MTMIPFFDWFSWLNEQELDYYRGNGILGLNPWKGRSFLPSIWFWTPDSKFLIENTTWESKKVWVYEKYFDELTDKN